MSKHLLIAVAIISFAINPSLVRAGDIEKELTFEFVESTEDWMMSKDDIDPAEVERLYQEQLAWNAEQEKKAKQRSYPANAQVIHSQVTDNGKLVKNNSFALGQCTDYVSRKTTVTWRGNANQWANNAKAQGYAVDKTPEVGAILQTRESRYGHVAYIEAVNGSMVTVSEWNYAGLYQKTTRTIDVNSSIVVGVIHN